MLLVDDTFLLALDCFVFSWYLLGLVPFAMAHNVPKYAMQNNPQPPKLHRTGNKSGRCCGGMNSKSNKCNIIMRIHDNAGTCLVMYASENMSISFSYDDDPDAAIRARPSMHRKMTRQQT